MRDSLAATVGDELAEELTKALGCIRHCLDQLNDDQVWWRPSEAMNSIGNLLLHLTGNVRQWVVSGLGAAADARNRPAEFAERERIPKAELLAQVEATVAEAKAVLLSQDAESWLRLRRVQGFDMTGLSAAINSVAHFRGHTQEIIHMTRTILGERYRVAWAPTTPEQGAPASE